MNASRMQPIYLKMGQSTVLRFQEKPVKVVIGNQNYYSVEFIDNDLTIQPLDGVKTNLFVYGKNNHVYGFILRTNARANYDDLVNVHWNYEQAYSLQMKPRDVVIPKAKFIHKTMNFDGLQVNIKKIWFEPRLGVYVLDSVVKNLGKEELDIEKIGVDFTRRDKSLKDQEHVFDKDEIRPRSSVRLRSLIKLPAKKGFSFYVKFGGKRKRIIVSRVLL